MMPTIHKHNGYSVTFGAHLMSSLPPMPTHLLFVGPWLHAYLNANKVRGENCLCGNRHQFEEAFLQLAGHVFLITTITSRHVVQLCGERGKKSRVVFPKLSHARTHRNLHLAPNSATGPAESTSPLTHAVYWPWLLFFPAKQFFGI